MKQSPLSAASLCLTNFIAEEEMNDETYGKLKTFYCGCCVWLPAWWPAIHISSANQLKFLAKNKPKLPFLKFHGFDSFQFFISFIKFFLLFFIPTSL